jgi:hypothetical protein
VNPRIKNIFLGCYAATIGFGILFGVVSVLADHLDHGAAALVRLCMMLPIFAAVLGWLGSTLFWVYDAWSSVPEEHRNAPVVGATTPAMAVGFLFVPCLNLVWMFLINYAISESINRALEERGSPERCSTALAISASAFHLIPYLNVLFGSILWYLWMRSADRARAHLARVDAGEVADVFS